jgi:hypothetical protein
MSHDPSHAPHDPHLPPDRLTSAQDVTRRHFFGELKNGVGLIALASMLGNTSRAHAATTTDTPTPSPADLFTSRLPHFAPKAKRVIYMHMAGSPPQQDLFDYKPRLNELNGQLCPDSLLEKERFAFIKGHPKILGSPYRFSKVGKSGMWCSNLLPSFASIADEVTLIRSMYTDQFNHAPAELFLYTGSPRLGRPSIGSWAVYGLGSENQNLPGFVVLLSGGSNPSSGKSVWGSGFLPSVYQGCQCRSEGEPVLYVNNPKGVDRTTAAKPSTSSAISTAPAMPRTATPKRSAASRSTNSPSACRSQSPMSSTSHQSPATSSTCTALTPPLPASPETAFSPAACSNAASATSSSSTTAGMSTARTPATTSSRSLPAKCRQTDQAAAALVLDLKQRGMLEDTLVVWSGEFGRTAMNEERAGSKFLGRDHHPHCFTIWMAGGGLKKGHVHGETDELGYRITKDPVHIHDLQATMLHALGLNHEKLTYRFQGRDFRLTDVHGRVIHELFA